MWLNDDDDDDGDDDDDDNYDDDCPPIMSQKLHAQVARDAGEWGDMKINKYDKHS